MQYPDESLNEILGKIEVEQSSFNELVSSLKELAGDNLSNYLNLYFEGRIRNLLRDTLNMESAELSEVWRILDGIQVAVCRFLYKENLQLSVALEDFAHDFDRIDDPQIQVHILEQLKRNELSYA